MRYLLLIGVDEEVADSGLADAERWVRTMTERGVRTTGGRLRGPKSATTVRVSDDGDVLLSDGPFAETKEEILGFDLLECADLDEAIAVAAAHPAARLGAVEVRPLWDPS